MSFNEVNQSTAELTQIAGSTLTSVYADAPIGAISAYGGDVAPAGWLLCNGAAISRTTYAELYAVIGTKFGAGDGSTTFNLPDGSISAAVYPVEDVGEYIIKAVQTSVPADFETALALKQDITDNTLETTDKTIPGAINELNTDLTTLNVKLTANDYTFHDTTKYLSSLIADMLNTIGTPSSNLFVNYHISAVDGDYAGFAQITPLGDAYGYCTNFGAQYAYNWSRANGVTSPTFYRISSTPI